MERCDWAGSDERMVAYHDDEWGLPVRDDRRTFEFLVLESAQAGLSWSTVLNKREGYRRAFAEFDMDKVARFRQERVEKMLMDASIIRNRMKIDAAINNARRSIELRKEFGGLADYFWSWVDGSPIINNWERMSQLPAKTDLAEALAKDMKQRGFKFFGPTIAYAHMQATGLVNDHVISCFRWKEVQL